MRKVSYISLRQLPPRLVRVLLVGNKNIKKGRKGKAKKRINIIKRQDKNKIEATNPNIFKFLEYEYKPDRKTIFFPRASERRVLPIVGVCISSSHLHTFSSSHLLIFTPSHLHLLIFTPSHLHIFSHTFSSSHLLSHLPIPTSAHPPSLAPSRLRIFSLSLALSPLSSLLSLSPFSLPFLSLASLIFLSSGRGWCRRGVTKNEPFRTK